MDDVKKGTQLLEVGVGVGVGGHAVYDSTLKCRYKGVCFTLNTGVCAGDPDVHGAEKQQETQGFVCTVPSHKVCHSTPSNHGCHKRYIHHECMCIYLLNCVCVSPLQSVGVRCT